MQYIITKSTIEFGYVFRNRFESKVMLTELQTLKCIKYIHMNPVKANMVKSEEQYKFSSYNDYIKKSKFINSENLNSIFNSKKDYFNELFKIEYTNLNLEKEKINMKIVLEEFLKEKSLELEDVKKDTNKIKIFISYLVTNEYQFTKTEVSKVLGISRASLYRELRK